MSRCPCCPVRCVGVIGCNQTARKLNCCIHSEITKPLTLVREPLLELLACSRNKESDECVALIERKRLLYPSILQALLEFDGIAPQPRRIDPELTGAALEDDTFAERFVDAV